MRARAIGLTALFVLTACGPSAEEEAARIAAEEAAIAQAAMTEAQDMYDPANFDSISWEAPAEAIERGATVFRFSCQKCHGPTGAGDGGFVQGGDTLHPPSFLEADWRFAEDRDGLREAVFVGAVEGMPHWGMEGLKYRDVDAVAIYIQDDLRN
jgi:mono/diheme cytochrome c family protein